jgi:hypothetical protein
VTRKMGIRWHLRELMAQQGMFATTDLVPLLAERGVVRERRPLLLTSPVPGRPSRRTVVRGGDHGR